MNFYIDFEANQFSDRIISIGCVSESNQTFYTLVKPSKDKEKLTNFIIELTGITNEMIEAAPTADEAFNLFFNWILENGGNEPPHYFCYGNSDKDFITKTVRYMKDLRAITFALSIQAAMEDYATQVKIFFNSSSPIALNRVYNFMNENLEKQNHNALEDAQMLQYVIKHLSEKCSPKDISSLPASVNHRKPGKKAPAIFNEWANGKGQCWKVNTRAFPSNYFIYAYNRNNGQIKYFDSYETAALWILKYFANNLSLSPKNPDHITKIEDKIKNAVESEKEYYGMVWRIKEEDDE